MVDFRRGSAAIEQANQAQQSGGGNKTFRPFAPQIFFAKQGDEGDTRYLLFLNAMDDIPTVDMVTFIPQTRKRADGSTYQTFEQVIARTDPAIGESTDPMVEDWDGKARSQNIAAAVELEPDTEEIKGRTKVLGFKVKTREFDRKVRDEDGEITDEVETVTSPEVGFVVQSPTNFYNVVAAYDAADAPIETTPVRVTRVGRDQNTTYQITGFPDLELDLSELIDNAEFIGYLSNNEEELDSLLEDIDAAETDLEAAHVIGAALLDKRLHELADKEVYDSIYKTITASLDKFGGGSKKKPAAKKAAPARKSRPSSRRASSKSSEDTTAEEPEAQEEVNEEPVEEAPKKTRARRTSTAKASSGASSDTKDKLAALRDRARKANESE